MDFERVNIKGGSAYENVAGYSRIVKAGPFVYVSGTTSVTPEGTVYGEGDPYEQAKYIFNKLVGLLEENGVTKCGIIHGEDGTPRIAYQKMSLTLPLRRD